jgi:alanine-glyoxylate transaminase / serine-glyoxylate transaminase / serine-pyruvate transaminase
VAIGPQFLQTRDPSNIPPSVLAATASPTIDHRGRAFAELTSAVLPGLQEVFGTSAPVVIYPSSGTIAAVMVVHNETSTGVRSSVPAVADAIRRQGHPALLLVDAVSSLGCTEYRHDEWSVDVPVPASQKGLMLPPGLGFNALSDKALAAAGRCRQVRHYWDWRAVLDANRRGFFPYTPATNLLFGLRAALHMLLDEGLPAVYSRHARLAGATRAAVSAWGLETVCADQDAHSDSVTAVLVPEGFGAAELNRIALDRYNLALGAGLGRLADRAFRIGHLGYLNEAALLAARGATELALCDAGVPPRSSGVSAALALLR